MTTPDKDAVERITPSCVEALENYRQADEEGILVLASRQAIHETVDAYWARVEKCDELSAEVKRLKAERDRWIESCTTLEQVNADLRNDKDAQEPVACVEPLEWRKLVDDEWVATDTFSLYRIRRDTIEPDTGTWQFLIGSTWYHGSESLKEAKEEVAIERSRRILSALTLKTEAEVFTRGFVAGFSISSEGWNGEYPSEFDPATDKYFQEHLAAAIRGEK